MGTPAQVIEQAALSGFDKAHDRKLERKDMLTDEQHAIKRDDLLKTKDSLVSQLATYKDANGNLIPEMKDQHDQAMAALSQNQFDFGQLYDPIKAPGKLQQDWHYLRDRIHGIKQPKTSAAAPPQASSVAVNTPAPPSITPAIPADPSVGQDAVPATTMPGMNSVPKGATPTMAVAKPKGLVEAGTIPIWNRPSVLNDDGTHSSELSISMGDDKGNQVLIPLIVGGKFLTPDGKMPPGPIPHNAQEWEKASPEWKALKMRAWQNYEKTGEHLGKFGGETAEDDVDAYAQVLHNRGSAGATTTLPVAPGPTVTKAPAPSWGQAQVLKHKAAAMQKAQQEAGLLASGAPLSPEQQASVDARAEAVKQELQINSTLAIAKKLGIELTPEEIKQKMGFKSFALKPIPGVGGQPVKQPDGTYARPMSTSDNTTVWEPMPAGWKPNSKAVAGGIVNTKQYGWVKFWVDPYDPSRKVGFQKITPGRQYTGSTSSSSSTDIFGNTTSSERSTMPVGTAAQDMDLSGMKELPTNFNGDLEAVGSTAPSESPLAPAPSGSPNKTPAASPTPPKSVAKPATGGTAPKVTAKTGTTPAQLKSQIPAPPPETTPQASGQFVLDSNGHIPADAPYNKNNIGAANDLLDGMALKDLRVPVKDIPGVEDLARKYGWGGQGMFSPQQKLQIKEASTFLNDAIKSDALSVLDSRISREKLIAALNNSEGRAGWTDAFVARNFNLDPKEAEFLRMYRQLTGTISGLASLTRPGRPTEAGIKRLMFELPNPNESHSATDAKARIKRLVKEIDIATQKGNADNMFGGSPSTNANGGLSLEDFKKKHNLQ